MLEGLVDGLSHCSTMISQSSICINPPYLHSEPFCGEKRTWASECCLPASACLVVAPERSLDCCFPWDSPSCLTSVTPGRSTHTAVHKACGWPCGAVPIGCTFPPTSQPFKQLAKPLFFPPVFHHSRQLHY